MVLGGVKTKSRRNPAIVNVDYLIHILDIKPWPPTPSLKTLRSVLIQWENGDRSSGTTAFVVPDLDNGKIEFNETFKLPVVLSREFPIKPGGDSDIFQKNCLEFNLYEPRRDKSVKGQLLGTAIIDLAEYGVVRESLSVSAIVNCQRNFRNTAQPILYVKIDKVGKKGQSGGLFREGSVKGSFLDKNGGESVSALMSEEYAEEAEMASATDDDGSSHSSLNVSSSSAGMSNGGSPSQNDKNSSEIVKDDTGQGTKDITVSSGRGLKISDTIPLHGNQQESFSCSMSIDLSSSQENLENGNGSISNSSESSTRINKHRDIDQEVLAKAESDINEIEASVDPRFLEHTLILEEKNRNIEHEKESNINDENDQVLKDTTTSKFPQDTAPKRSNINDENDQVLKDTTISKFSQDTAPKRVSLGSDPLSYSTVNRLRHVKSVRSLSESSKSNGFLAGNQFIEDSKDINIVGDAHTGSRKASWVNPKDAGESKIQQLEQRIKMLEAELREAAAVEVALYSVVAEHGSSMSKVHAPARRLSRLYLHACKEKALSRRANAARAAVSGIRLVAKACGNDVPRLTFWLSNSVLLRIIISQATGDSELPVSHGPSIERSDIGKADRNRPSPLKWESSSSMRGSENGLCENVKVWEDPNTFTSALEKIEAWIFSRIIESVWWQTLTPHMQSAAAKAIDEGVGFNSSKCCRRASILGDQEKVSLSLDLWKKAFQDARERLCPVRAGGHECGCLPLLTKLIMEQCVARLDVAMLNAILRESDDEIPTDPISDPISDAKVLPIPAGQFSVGAGAQLKNAIGNWSRLLSDLFGMDDDVSLGDESDQNDDNERHISSFKSFHILNALSDLMMLPKDMLLSRSIRKEVCPTFGGTLIKRVINSFVPDEFCPDPVPEDVLKALNSEDALENEEFVTNFPCTAAPTVYLPPTAASVAHIVGELKSSELRRSGSSVMRKSYTSEDELDELDSPLTCIITDNLRDSPKPANSIWMSNKNGTRKAIRYQLLREVWMDSV